MCSGRVDLDFVIRAFLEGMDGVLIGGCRLNECNYTTHGNYNALNMVLLCRRIMEHVGIEPDRLRIEFMNSGEGILFAEVVDDFTGRVKELGPLGSGNGIDSNEIRSRLEEISRLVPYIKIAKREKLESRLENEEAYDRLFTIHEVEELLREAPSYYIDPDKCQACMICMRRCPVEAIDGAKSTIHVIDQERCVKCETCFEVCPPRFGAVNKLIAEPVPSSIPEEARAIVRGDK